MVIQRTGSGIKNMWKKSFGCRRKDECWHGQTACSPLEPTALRFAHTYVGTMDHQRDIAGEH